MNLQDIASDWRINLDVLDGVTPLVYDYTYADYSGSAYGLFQRIDGSLFEVHGSHCSCYGLEDQWCEEDVTIEFVRDRLANGTYVSRSYSAVEAELQAVVNFLAPSEEEAAGTAFGEAVFNNIVNQLT
jgi:hypothetical protein